MKKTTKILLARVAAVLTLAMLLPLLGQGGVWAQSEVVSVGSGGGASGYLPSYPDNTYAMSQQIYTSAEIGRAGMITSVAFYNYDTGSARNYDIYLSHTTKETFDSSTDWVTVDAADKVFSGTVTLSQGVWTVIDFDTPFQYDGTQNLLLTVDDNTGKGTGNNYSVSTFDGSGSQALYYYKMFGNPVNLDPTQPMAEEGSTYYRKNKLQLCFETWIKPYRLEATEVGDVSALIQCSLRGDAIAWNLRYRKVAAEGEEEQRWTTPETITDRSYTIEGLTPATKYEVQVQAVFDEENLSDWTEPLVFTTNCCPVEQQAELIYALRSRNYVGWFGFAVQIVDITDEDHPVEAAYLHTASYEPYGGTVTLCCGHKYQVNWIYDADYAVYNSGKSFALYFEPGDLIYSMAYGEAPEETTELTTFVMDCTPYCAQKPQSVSVSGTTFNSATLSFISNTDGGEVVYSSTPDFDPDTATPTSVSFDAIPVDPDSWVANPVNSSLTLTGLDPLTAYYVRLRGVCDDGGVSRWSDPVKVTTGSRYDAPSQVTATPVNSRTENLSWQSHGNEKGYNLAYRQQATGTAVETDAVGTFGSGKGTGFDVWGEGAWCSYGDGRPYSNTLFVGGIQAGSSFGFKAGQAKTGLGKTQFVYGLVRVEAGKTAKETMVKFDKECLNDADRAAIIEGLNAKKQDLVNQLAALEIKLLNGEITREEYDQQKAELDGQVDAYDTEIGTLEALPTDAEKLAEMKRLEERLDEYRERALYNETDYMSGTITKEQYEITKEIIENDRAQTAEALNKLRAQTSAAENPQKDGFSISNKGVSDAANARRSPDASGEDDTYVFFVRHANDDGMLLVKDLTIMPPESLNDWIVIPNIIGTEYTLTGLEAETTYEVMVEPVYEDGLTGSASPVTVFTTIGAETDPVEGEFSVSEDKKVSFARGNLRYSGDIYEGTWSMAKQQYEVLGEENIDVQGTRSYPADYRDLLCWSTATNHYGVSNYYYYDEEEVQPFFQGDFADWGESPALVSELGPGWSTLTKTEWEYLLNGRENASQLRQVATVAGVKGLLLLPDGWLASSGVAVSEEITAEQWTSIEQAGAVFLPAAGQLTTTYENYTSTTTVTEACTYWTGTPSDDESGLNAVTLTIDDEGVKLDTDLSRRVAVAVRLVKSTAGKQQAEIFDEYKKEKEDECDDMGMESDDDYCRDLIANAKKTIRLLGFDPGKTLEENQAVVDAIVAKLAEDLAAYRSTTGIKLIPSPSPREASGAVYDLTGRKLNGKPARRGVYINNGRKVVVN